MQPIQDMINKALVRKERERSGKWSPSSFGKCYRAQYWNRKDEPKSNPPDERTLRVFKCGDLFEDFVAGLIMKDNHCEQQVLIETDDVKGFADFVFENEVTDIKSQHSKSFWYMAKYKNDDIKKDKYPNWLQVGYYARELKKEFMRLVFISKDDLCIKEFVQKLDDYWLAEIEKELITLRGLWSKQGLPPAKPRCEPRKDGTYWECDYCNWKDKCKEIEDGVLAQTV